MPGRTTATLLAAALVGVLVPGIAVLSARGAPPSRTATLAEPPLPIAPRRVSATSPGEVVATTTTTTATTTTTSAPGPTTSPATTAPTPSTLAVPIVTHVAAIEELAPEHTAAPVRVVVPSVGADGPVVLAGVNPLGELDVPPDAGTLVWYRHGPTPGARGSAVIAGHLNWRGERGVFADLAEVPVGGVVTVVYDDGSQRDFAVRAVELVPKPAVSVNGVFARRGEPLLRLVTCGGEFDGATSHYRSNVVVTAAPL